jgi:hypothetical protein
MMPPKPRNHISLKKITPETTKLNQIQNLQDMKIQ